MMNQDNQTNNTDEQTASPPAISSEEAINPQQLDESAADNTAEPSKTVSVVKKIIASIFSWVIVPILIVLFVHNFIFQAFYVSGTSMDPTFRDGDYLVISKVNITLNNLKRMVGIKNASNLTRGDVIVFRYPPNPTTFFVKRVIGLPGDRVVIKDGTITIYNKEFPQGKILKEPYISSGTTTSQSIDTIVEPDTVFVMGDNRTPGGSYDSREWGNLPYRDIIGRAELRLLPIGSFGVINDPAY